MACNNEKKDAVHPITKILFVLLLVEFLLMVSAKIIFTNGATFPSALTRRGGSSSAAVTPLSTRIRSLVSGSLSCSPTLHYHGRMIPRTPTEDKATERSSSSITTHEDNGDDNILVQKKLQMAEMSSTDFIDIEEFDRIAKDVENWAEDLLSQNDVKIVPKKYHGSDEGGYWYELKCRKPHKFNANGQTKLFLNWMKDSRGEKYARKQHKEHHVEGENNHSKSRKKRKESDPDSSTARATTSTSTTSSKLHPCMKVISTINAPFEDVCLYLSQPKHYRDYNTLLVNVRDIEHLSRHSKLCWGQTPKLLFIKPRDFITFCTHKWLRDDTQLILSQACYDGYKGIDDDKRNNDFNYKNGKNYHLLNRHVIKNKIPLHPNGPRAYALRGATYIRRNPNDPENSTRIYILAHCDCGEDIPQWAVKTAVGILAPIKPFEIIHRINVGITKKWDKEKAWKEFNQVVQGDAEMTNNHPQHIDTDELETRRSTRPAGFAQMGYGSFWPDGGGPIENSLSTDHLDELDRICP